MRILVFVAVMVAALVAAGSATAATATHECDGLQICVPVAGPWVVVPTGAKRATVEYQLDCPSGYIVGGLDAELTSNAIDLSFTGSLGSPVNPGITTARSAVFSGTYVGLDPRTAQSFRPHIGCIPASGGGGRVPTSVSAIVRPGRPTTRRVQTVHVRAGTSRVTSACASAERLIAASHALGFYTDAPPGRGLVGAVGMKQAVRANRAIVSLRAGKAINVVRAVVQVGVVCAGGK